MKRIMLIGRSGCGKTTLSQALQGHTQYYRKTQAIDYYPAIIDTPGEYLESRRYFAALRATAGDCETIGLVQDATDDQSVFPPQFAGMFQRPVIGIVTKIEAPAADSDRAINHLRQAGAGSIILTSCFLKLGLELLRPFLIDGRGGAQ